MSFDFKKMLLENIQESKQSQKERMVRETSQKNFIDSEIHHRKQNSKVGANLLNENASIKLDESLLIEICYELFETTEFKNTNSHIIKENRKLREAGEDYYHQIVKEYIHQTRGIPLAEIQLNEGIWDFVKKITKKVGDAIEAEKTDLFGGISKEDQAKFDSIIDKATDERIKNLVQIIKKEAPDFPNGKEKIEFQSVLAAFEVAYESLYKAAEAWCADPDAEGGTDPKTAEELIKKLRFLLRFYLDKKLFDKYRYLRESEEREELTEHDRILEELGIIIELLAIEKQLTEATVFGGVADTGGGRDRQPRGIRSGGSGEYAQAEKILGDKKLTQMWYQVDIAMRAGPRPTGLPPEEFKKFIDNMRSGGRTPEEATAMLLKSIKGSGKAPGASGAETGETGETPEGTDAEQAKQAVKYRKWKLTDKPGVITGEFNPEGGSVVVMKSLESHKLPLFLLGIAGMLGAYGWLVRTPLIQNWLKSFFESGAAESPKQVWETFSQSEALATVGELNAGNGMSGYLQALGLGNFGPNENALKALKGAAKQLGDGDTVEGFSAMSTLFENPAAKQALLDRIAQFEATNPNVTMAEFFPSGPEDTGLWLVHPGSGIVKTITTTMLKATGKGVAKTALKGTVGAAIIASLGSWAIPLGLAIIPAAAGVALLRWKGRKMSRAQMINDVLKRMKPPEDCIEKPGPKEDCEDPNQVWDEKTGECIDDDTCPPDQVWDEEKGECVPKPGPTPVKPCEDDETWNEKTQKCEPTEDVPPEDSSLINLLRMDDDGMKYYKSARRNPEKRKADKDTMQRAQDNVITGRDSDPSSEDLRNVFGKMFANKKNPEDLTMAQMADIISGRSEKDLESYFTIDASVYNDMAQGLKSGGFIKTARLNKKLKAAIKDAVATILKQMVRKNPAQKLTYKQVQPTLIRAFKKVGIKLNKDGGPMLILLKVLEDYGLIRGGVPDTEGGKKAQTTRKKAKAKRTARQKKKDAKLKEILRRINERLEKANKKLITEKQLAKYLKRSNIKK